MDALAKISKVGLMRNTPPGMKPGSDIANMAVLGYDPAKYYTGRSPLEAASLGIKLTPADISFRCNLVTLSDEPDFGDKRMLDYCGGDISTAEADVLIKFLADEFASSGIEFHTGNSYRHCLVWRGLAGEGFVKEDLFGRFTPPHDFSDKAATAAVLKMGEGRASGELLRIMERSFELLSNHPVNLRRAAEGKRPANSMWIWGEGLAASLPNFREKNGVSGGIISAVDLLKGIGQTAGMETPEVEGATGYLDTNFEGKRDAALQLFKNGTDYVYLHIEAPDECGHRGEYENKVRAVELIDERILGPLLKNMEGEHMRVLICPDHPTPLATKTHSSDPVPFLFYDTDVAAEGVDCFCESSAKGTGLYVGDGFSFIDEMISQN
ncbi:putative 2,3-bisphosphoglycerate-independent phosphoglycerate mutase [Clostridia bacterium]|nr:putative 2,3-bisphosphoglycerate-independent phosphoglycerate mutase [Clostridia bacterium]